MNEKLNWNPEYEGPDGIFAGYGEYDDEESNQHNDETANAEFESTSPQNAHYPECEDK